MEGFQIAYEGVKKRFDKSRKKKKACPCCEREMNATEENTYTTNMNNLLKSDFTENPEGTKVIFFLVVNTFL
jgi:hypothetical protein